MLPSSLSRNKLDKNANISAVPVDRRGIGDILKATPIRCTDSLPLPQAVDIMLSPIRLCYRGY